MKLSVVIPVYNERQFIAEILTRVQAVHIEGIETEIIVVDDCSIDGTRDFLEEIARKSLIDSGTFLKTAALHNANFSEKIKILCQQTNQR
jgi:glycosyltransferase involved in cell wall biosynthesis